MNVLQIETVAQILRGLETHGVVNAGLQKISQNPFTYSIASPGGNGHRIATADFLICVFGPEKLEASITLDNRCVSMDTSVGNTLFDYFEEEGAGAKIISRLQHQVNFRRKP